MNSIEEFIDEMERDLRESEEKEIPASVVGEKIMAKLHELDDVAYVRFASVYREFKDVNDFVAELKKHFASVGTRKPAASRAESAETYLLARRFKGSPEAPAP
jgi:transcriptional regulator NrdR family protein